MIRHVTFGYLISMMSSCFVCHAYGLSLGYRRAHCEGYIAAIYRSILIQFQRFWTKKRSDDFFQKHLNYITRWRHICLGIRSKFGFFFKNSNDNDCGHDFDHLGEG